MRKSLYLLVLSLIIFLSACHSSNLPLDIKTDDSMEQVKSGADFKVYSHKTGYLLIKGFESSQNPLYLYERLSEDEQRLLNSLFAIGSKAINSDEMGFKLKSYNFKEYRPIIVGENNIYGVISEIETQEDAKHREFLIFCSEERAYYMYYVSDIKNDTFYQLIKNISMTDLQSTFAEDISTDVIITGQLDLGHDEEEQPYFIIYKKKDQIAKAAREDIDDTDKIGIVVQVNSNRKEIKEATIDACVEIDGKIYKNNGNAYFNLEPKEVCEYSLLLPIDQEMTKMEIEKLIDAMKITMRYKSNGLEMSRIIKEGNNL